MRLDTKKENEVAAALEYFTDAYARRDLQNLLNCFAQDADLVLFGTGADEKRVGPAEVRAQVERDWSQTDTAAVKFKWTSISGKDNVAWAAADGSFTLSANGDEMNFPVRITFVLENREGRWFVVQSHFSVPAAGQEEGQSF